MAEVTRFYTIFFAIVTIEINSGFARKFDRNENGDIIR